MKTQDLKRCGPPLRPLIGAVSLAVTLLWAGEAAAEPDVRSETCKPGPQEIAVYAGEDFAGPCVIKGVGEHGSGSEYGHRIGLRVDAARFASIRVGTGVEALACAGASLIGPCVLITHDEKSLAAHQASRPISSAASFYVRLRNGPRHCEASAGQVALWSLEYYFGSCFKQNLGDWASGDSRPIRSLQVGADVEIMFCTNQGFPCDVATPGNRSNWSFGSGVRRYGEPISWKVRRAHECRPSDNQVVVFQHPDFDGDCRLFDVGTHSLNGLLDWSDGRVRSLMEGDNVDIKLCFDATLRPERRACAIAQYDVIRDMNNVTNDDHPTLMVWRHGERPPDYTEPEPSDADVERTYTIQLAAQEFFEGFAWHSGRFPLAGSYDGNLLAVQNKTAVWVGLLKPGFGSDSCGNPDARVVLQKDEGMTADQMWQVFESSQPRLPVQFFACSGLIGEARPEGQLNYPSVSLKLTYTR